MSGPPERVIIDAEPRFVAVVSHDCEFNEGKRQRVLVARLQKVQGNLSADRLDHLRRSNDIEAQEARGETVAGVDSFVVPPLPGCFDDEQVIHFTTIMPLPMEMLDYLAERKWAELQHDERLRLRKKLAWFFVRSHEDIPADEKEERPAHVRDAEARHAEGAN